jgi:hypothetical protein
MSSALWAMTSSDDILRRHFSAVLADAGSTGAVGEILSLLSQGCLKRAAFAEIIERHELNRESWFSKQRLDLVLGYVSALVADGDLDAEHLKAISNLKNCLGVTEGDFVSLRPAEVAAILAGELEQILEDDSIDEEEDLRQADLQDVFDLSYDQYLQLTRIEFERAMSSLVERLERARGNGDNDLVRQLEHKIAALDPVYRLAVSQHRRLGGLY